MKDLVLKLREARMLAGLSQQELADKARIGVKTISSFETGARVNSIKVAHLERIVEACGMTLAEFVAWSPEYQPDPKDGTLPPDRRPWLERRYA